LAEKRAGARGELAAGRQAAAQGQVLRDGMTVVIAGRPNAGKSSLLNALAESDAAIVTEIAGTTRDTLRERIQIDGMPLHVIDTAGRRESADVVEQEGIRRAWRAIAEADRLLLVVDDREGPGPLERQVLAERSADTPVTIIRNKVDLSGGKPGEDSEGPEAVIRLSAKTGAGLDLLREHLKACMGYHAGEGSFTARRRHLDALDRADAALQLAAGQLAVGAGELMAEELRQAQQALAEITGEFTSEDLLGAIFSTFCIGK
ncbi:MAG: 50S ribosome-binding GTPase, partial [Ectothiorhodospiraceae bacterium]|nr:50S ribosome-binding GTPase [Ectothiorhodospiraceae bacterium]